MQHPSFLTLRFLTLRKTLRSLLTSPLFWRVLSVCAVFVAALAVECFFGGLPLQTGMKHAFVGMSIALAIPLLMDELRLPRALSTQALPFVMEPGIISVVYAIFMVGLNRTNPAVHVFTPLAIFVMILGLRLCLDAQGRAWLASRYKHLLASAALKNRWHWAQQRHALRLDVVVIGTCQEAALFVQQLKASSSPWRVVGIIEDRPPQASLGDSVAGVRILGSLQDLPHVLAHTALPSSAALLLLPSLWSSQHLIPTLLALHSDAWFAARHTLVRLSVDPETSETQLLPVQMDDVFSQAVSLSAPAGDISAIVRLRTILITGACSDLGHALCRQLLPLAPSRLVLLDTHETRLLELSEDLMALAPDTAVHRSLVDLSDKRRVESIVAHFAPDLVFHLAGMTQADMIEENILEALTSNVISMFHMAEACRRNRVQAMVLATHAPTHATSSKLISALSRMSEITAQLFDLLDPTFNLTRYVPVRLPNILHRPGSISARLQRAVINRHRFTIDASSDAVTLITPTDAARLLLHSLLNREETGTGRLYATPLGTTVRVRDLAEIAMTLARVHIPVHFKQLEVLGSRDDKALHLQSPTEPTSSPYLVSSCLEGVNFDVFMKDLQALKKSVLEGDIDECRALLRTWVPDLASSAASSAR